MEDKNDPFEVPPVVPNRFTADAHRRTMQLRAIGEEFPDDEEPVPLTSMEVRLARHTPVMALEKAAVFAEAVPGVAGDVDVTELRETIAFELAYGAVLAEARAVAHKIEHAILRRKLRAVRVSRGMYRMAKAYVTLDSGDPIRPLVEAFKETLVRPRRRKSVATP